MAKYSIDKTLEKEVQDYMKAVIKKLESDGTKLDETYNAGLYILADNYNTVVKCNKQLANEGLTTTDRFGGTIANPLIKIKNDASIQAQKMLQEFLLTKKAQVKVNEPTTTDCESSLEKWRNKKITNSNNEN